MGCVRNTLKQRIRRGMTESKVNSFSCIFPSAMLISYTEKCLCIYPKSNLLHDYLHATSKSNSPYLKKKPKPNI